MSESSLPISTRHGVYKKKHHLRALFRSIAFVVLIGGYFLYNGLVEKPTSSTQVVPQLSSLSTATTSKDQILRSEESGASYEYASATDTNDHSSGIRRKLAQLCSEIDKADPEWLLVFYCIGVLYMFLGLAIVCDEFFVPALEEMSGERRLNLSMDVAGATLMAAGGSAPELFTSLIGTFQESEVGIGTIVGSAVFNVLFVIAMCSMLAKEVLTLTWWPLFRDSLYYAIGLLVLAMFIGVVSPDEVFLWEAIVLFGMYLGYILVMAYNRDIYMFLTGNELVYPGEEEEEDDIKDEDGFVEEGDSERPKSVGVGPDGHRQMAPHFRWQGTFRAGILKLLRDPEDWVDAGGVGIVAKISGDVDHVFKQVDLNGDGNIDREELGVLFRKMEINISEDELDKVFVELDTNKNGVICEKEFETWYIASEERILSQVKHVFDRFDTDRSGTIDKDELKQLLVDLDHRVTDEDIAEAMEVMYKHGDPNEITYEEFAEWYKSTLLYERRKNEVEEELEGVWESLKPPKKPGIWRWTKYLIVLPLVAAMTFTIPDVRRPGVEKWCYVAFITSILHIGGYSYLMVTWVETIGNTLGIPSVVMGYTVLAAGTSVPDLLSSVIVARRGNGDMAVSSSIGSNIFDILVGLPIPWILYTAWPTTESTVLIGSENIWINIMVLMGMLVFVIVAVHFQGWKLTKLLGAMMLLFYVGFLVLAILLELPFETCING